jgi:hypothetical protein
MVNMARQATLEDAHQALDRVEMFLSGIPSSRQCAVGCLLQPEDFMVLASIFIDTACGGIQDTALTISLLHYAMKGRIGGASA